MNRLVTVGCALLLLVVCVFAGTATNFAGSYSAKPAKGDNPNSATSLRVVQTDKAIEITRVQGGRTSTSRFPLDGSEGDYTSSGGVVGKGKAQFKGKDLILESVTNTKPQQNGPSVRMRTKERWQLSSDSKVLTIRFNVDFPELSRVTGGITDQSWTETYLRSDIRSDIQ